MTSLAEVINQKQDFQDDCFFIRFRSSLDRKLKYREVAHQPMQAVVQTADEQLNACRSSDSSTITHSFPFTKTNLNKWVSLTQTV